MKKLVAIAAFVFGLSLTANAQHPINSFFDDMGGIRLETQELDQAADTLVTIAHRKEDVVWARVVYSIIDMRFKQNFPLYFPTRSDDARYRALFRVILDAMVDGLPIYEKNATGQKNIQPVWDAPIEPVGVPRVTMLVENSNETYAENHNDIATSDDMLLHYDSVNHVMSTNYYGYETFVRNQLKYLVQEVIFFDRHTSRLYRKILAIAPLHSDNIQTTDRGSEMNALFESIMFWIPFDALRPYLAKQYVIPSQNETKRVSFEEFFTKRMYTQYIVGEGNMYDRMILDYTQDETEVKKEQARIENELLTFEQDLWEY